MPLKNQHNRRLAAPLGKRGCVTAAFQQDRTGQMCVTYRTRAHCKLNGLYILINPEHELEGVVGSKVVGVCGK